MRVLLAAAVVIVMGCAIAGIGIGQSPAEREAAPSPRQVGAAKQRIAAAGATVTRGRELFDEEGCDRCHSIGAIGAEGKLGPRLDTIDEDADDIVESIARPREDTVDGYPEKLMPTDYARRLSEAEVGALAAFIAAAAGTQEDGAGENSGRGRNRGRGGDHDDGSGRR